MSDHYKKFKEQSDNYLIKQLENIIGMIKDREIDKTKTKKLLPLLDKVCETDIFMNFTQKYDIFAEKKGTYVGYMEKIISTAEEAAAPAAAEEAAAPAAAEAAAAREAVEILVKKESFRKYNEKRLIGMGFETNEAGTASEKYIDINEALDWLTRKKKVLRSDMGKIFKNQPETNTETTGKKIEYAKDDVWVIIHIDGEEAESTTYYFNSTNNHMQKNEPNTGIIIGEEKGGEKSEEKGGEKGGEKGEKIEEWDEGKIEDKVKEFEDFIKNNLKKDKIKEDFKEPIIMSVGVKEKDDWGIKNKLLNQELTDRGGDHLKLPNNITLQDVRGNGECFYRAFINGLRYNVDKMNLGHDPQFSGKAVGLLKKLVVEKMSLCIKQGSKCETKVKEATDFLIEAEGGNLEDYKKTAEREGYYGGDKEAEIIADLFNVNIIQTSAFGGYTGDDGDVELFLSTIYTRNAINDDLEKIYTFHIGGHYLSILPRK